ncbi:MAG: hypothetical protein J6R59_11515 [Paludibacteraceae bacterium]|nr:hypothetical protein [Paludibacteraceae bacterium]
MGKGSVHDGQPSSVAENMLLAIQCQEKTLIKSYRSKKIKNLKAIYVPKSSITKYKTAEGWSEYKDKFLSLEELYKKEL